MFDDHKTHPLAYLFSRKEAHGLLQKTRKKRKACWEWVEPGNHRRFVIDIREESDIELLGKG